MMSNCNQYNVCFGTEKIVININFETMFVRNALAKKVQRYCAWQGTMY